MAILAAHLNDAGITFVNDEMIICQEPGFALLENNNLITGSEAFANISIKPRQIQNQYHQEYERIRYLCDRDLLDATTVTWPKMPTSDEIIAEAEKLYKFVQTK